jgi:hypothetical protein
MLHKNLKRAIGLLLAAVLLALFGNGALAQTGAANLAKAMTDSLAYLQLNSQQKTTAQKLNETAATSLVQAAKKAHADTSFQGGALAKQVLGIMKQRNASLEKVLNPEQTKLFQQRNIAQLADIQTKIMTAQLDLTNAQVPQVYQINLKTLTALKADKAKLASATNKFAKLKAGDAIKGDMKEKDKAMKKILSPDQYAIFQKHQKEVEAALKEKSEEKKKAS